MWKLIADRGGLLYPCLLVFKRDEQIFMLIGFFSFNLMGSTLSQFEFEINTV